MFSFLKRLLGGAQPAARFGVEELARRMGTTVAALRAVPISYSQFQIPKRSGGSRTIHAPAPGLKAIQRTILRRVLGKLKAHPCATGFERGHSIVTNALPHVGRGVIIKLDVKDFFTSTTTARVGEYFRAIGWDSEAAELLTAICTTQGALPQGAPTSPRLSNLVNYRLDARLAALAGARGASYSRYADDITFSDSQTSTDAQTRANDLIRATRQILKDSGYQLHTDKKLRIARRHDRQIVTGIVVNQKPNLPRKTRRLLRAVEHRLRTGRQPTMTPGQLQGWKSLQMMVATQGSVQPD